MKRKKNSTKGEHSEITMPCLFFAVPVRGLAMSSQNGGF